MEQTAYWVVVWKLDGYWVMAKDAIFCTKEQADHYANHYQEREAHVVEIEPISFIRKVERPS